MTDKFIVKLAASMHYRMLMELRGLTTRTLCLTLLWLVWCVCGIQAEAAEPAYKQELLNVGMKDIDVSDIAQGYLDSQFKPYDVEEVHRAGRVFWTRFVANEAYHPSGTPVMLLFKTRQIDVRVFSIADHQAKEVQPVIALSQYGAAHDLAFLAPEGIQAGQSWIVRVERPANILDNIRMRNDTMQHALTRTDSHAQAIDLTFGALIALTLSVFLIWLVLKDPMLIHYSLLIFTQALYIAYYSGQAFDWPLFKYAVSLGAYTWNIPIALSGAWACLFVRDITDMRHFSPQAHRAFGWMCWAFFVLAVLNVFDNFGLERVILAMGNGLFLITALFTLIMAFLAWRRGSRAAGFFLIAWTLLEVITIATTARLLVTKPSDIEFMLYYGLPLSMVAAAILMGLGVADRMREQRRALSDAERRAQTDSLTGVLNRRSFIERLEAACMRAKARDLPLSLLFIDLDHFKQINDNHGHLAGDACLKAIIPAINSELRQSDVIGRYGGEEFVVLLSSADVNAAQPLAERILRRIADVRVEGFGKPIRLTCSIGVASTDMLGEWGERLIAHADTAVYAAKLSGRNRVQLAQTLAA